MGMKNTKKMMAIMNYTHDLTLNLPVSLYVSRLPMSEVGGRELSSVCHLLDIQQFQNEWSCLSCSLIICCDLLF
jgi:hypothetical protein